ncbi:MAG: hypothetical protein M1823_001065, partial [Watsoniomyces obsoletus]
MQQPGLIHTSDIQGDVVFGQKRHHAWSRIQGGHELVLSGQASVLSEKRLTSGRKEKQTVEWNRMLLCSRRMAVVGEKRMDDGGRSRRTDYLVQQWLQTWSVRVLESVKENLGMSPFGRRSWANSNGISAATDN